jgi:hypothetical protein
VNRSHVTVIGRDAFVGGGYVRETQIRDGRVIREFSTAPVYRGPIPLVPTLASVRFATPASHHEFPRPPERFLDRHVATSLPPPPRPPSFNTKLDVIRESHGRPYHQPDVERHAPERTHETRATTGGPHPDIRDTTRARPDARPPKEYTGLKATPVPSRKKLDESRPHRPEGLRDARPPGKAPMRPADAAAKVQTPAPKVPTPAAKTHAAVEPHREVQKAPPEKIQIRPESQPKTQKAPVVDKPKTSTAPKPPPEKKPPSDKPVS